MPWYELWIEDGDRTLPSVHANDPAAAAAAFGQQLGRLTLEDQGNGAPYMLRETTEKNAHWSKRRPEIAVWIIRE
jgi:hypothetical protein